MIPRGPWEWFQTINITCRCDKNRIISMKRRCRCTLGTRSWHILILARVPVNWLLIVYPLPIPASESVATSLHGKMNHLKGILLAHLFCGLPAGSKRPPPPPPPSPPSSPVSRTYMCVQTGFLVMRPKFIWQPWNKNKRGTCRLSDIFAIIVRQDDFQSVLKQKICIHRQPKLRNAQYILKKKQQNKTKNKTMNTTMTPLHSPGKISVEYNSFV